MQEPRQGGVTRRQLVAGGVGLLAVAAAGVYGRFAIGDEFEEHVASVLGVPVGAARRFTRNAREHFGSGEYDLRAAAFVGATTFPGSLLHPAAVRERAVGGFVRGMFRQPADNTIYMGVQRSVDATGCAGLVRV
jgi:hypothetical protein